MSHFYGTLQGARGQATRCGSQKSGIHTQAASWRGCVDVSSAQIGEADQFHIWLKGWQGYTPDKAGTIATVNLYENGQTAISLNLRHARTEALIDELRNRGVIVEAAE